MGASSSKSLAGKRILVTGGSSGIGKAFAIAAAKEGAKVAILARNQYYLEEARKEIADASGSDAVWAAPANVSEKVQVHFALKELTEKMGGHIEILLSNAGFADPGEIESIDLARFERQMKVNWLGTVCVVKACLPSMKEHRSGRILIVSSQAGQVGIYGYTAYASSKFALRGFGEALYKEASPFGVNVGLVYPPDTRTPGHERELRSTPEITKKVSEDSETMSAERVAKAIIAGAKTDDFFVPIGFEGWMLSRLTSGMANCTSFVQGLQEVLLMSIFRLVSLVYLYQWDRIAKKVLRRERRL